MWVVVAGPLTGHRVPDLKVGDTGLFGLLDDGRAVLLDFSGTVETAAEQAEKLGIRTHAAAAWPGQPNLAVALVRPDGYLWWAADQASDDAVSTALSALDVSFAAR